MRTAIIALQAGAITVFAVIGAYGESDMRKTCPQPEAESAQICQDAEEDVTM